jgi:hypothetical protein
MKAGLKRFLWLWLPPLGLFLAGLHRAFLTGQADPWDWGLPIAVILGALGLLLARRHWAVQAWVALGGVGMALIFCALAAGSAPDGLAAIGLLAVALFAMFGGVLLMPRRYEAGSYEAFPGTGRGPAPRSQLDPGLRRGTDRGRFASIAVGIGLIAVAALFLWRGPTQPVQPVPDRPSLAVITGLPLFWDEAGRGGPRDAPIVTLLRTRFTVTPMDDPLHLKASGTRSLLLAQPRALTPAQLVAIDQWVRDGGTIVVLADPLLRWPSDLPLSDRRRAPSVSLLQPLLAHWGFRPNGVEKAEIRHRTAEAYLVTLSGAQVYADGTGDRQPLHRKRIGKGEVLLLGDADPIDDRLWLADPARPLDPRYWVADTPALLVHWLGGAAIAGDRLWMRESEDVTRAIRWALLAGTIWAMLGAMIFRRERRGFSPGTEKEHGWVKDNKSG